MHILNFSHPLTDPQKKQIQAALKITDDEWRNTKIHSIKCFLDMDKNLVPQVERILRSIPLSVEQLTSEQVVIVPPPIAYSAILLMVGLFAICGYYPPVIRRKKQIGSIPPQYVVAEIVHIDAFKDKARSLRK